MYELAVIAPPNIRREVDIDVGRTRQIEDSRNVWSNSFGIAKNTAKAC